MGEAPTSFLWIIISVFLHWNSRCCFGVLCRTALISISEPGLAFICGWALWPRGKFGLRFIRSLATSCLCLPPVNSALIPLALILCVRPQQRSVEATRLRIIGQCTPCKDEEQRIKKTVSPFSKDTNWRTTELGYSILEKQRLASQSSLLCLFDTCW